MESLVRDGRIQREHSHSDPAQAAGMDASAGQLDGALPRKPMANR